MGHQNKLQAFFIALTCMTGYASAQSKDLTPIFAGAETDCAASNAKSEKILKWMVPDKKGNMKAIKTAPEPFASTLTKTTVADTGDGWNVTGELTGATYNGLPVAQVVRWVGRENGIAGFSLVFAAPLNTVSQKLKVKKDDSLEPGVPKLMAEKGTGRAVLYCDFSN